MVVLSCSSRSFPEMPLESALARIVWAGFHAAELFLPSTEPLPEGAALAAMLQAEAVRVAAVDAGTLQGEDTPAALESAAHVGRCAVLAQSLQANRVVCDLALASESLAHEVISRLLAALAPVPVLLCLRNRAQDGPEALEQQLSLVAMDPDRLGLALDPGVACRAGWDPLAEEERVLPALRHLYVTDAAGVEPAAPGAGDVGWEALGERLRESGYSGAASLWLDGPAAFHDPLFAEAELKEARFLMESWFDGAG